jgi:hypothetical protein
LALPDDVGRGIYRSLASLWIALPEQRGHDLLDQPNLAVHRVAVQAKVPWLDPVTGEVGDDVSGYQGFFVVVHGTGDHHGFEDAEPLQSDDVIRAEPGSRDQLFKGNTGT